jgi:four helix bundle protein
MNTKMLMLDVCRLLAPVWKTLERVDRSLADQGRRAMQSMVLQFAEGLHAQGGHRKAKLLAARAEAHETRACLELATACELLSVDVVQPLVKRVDHIAAILWLKVHRPR